MRPHIPNYGLKKCKYCIREFFPQTPKVVCCPKCSSFAVSAAILKKRNEEKEKKKK